MSSNKSETRVWRFSFLSSLVSSAIDSPGRSKLWLSKNSDIFLLFDYVHVVKCLRNNWLTEKAKKLQYTFNGITQLQSGVI